MVCVSIYLYGLPKQEAAKLPRHSTDDTEVKQKLITVWGGGALERPSMDWYFLVLYWAQPHSGKESRTTDGRVLLRWHCFVVTCKYTGLMPGNWCRCIGSVCWKVSWDSHFTIKPVESWLSFYQTVTECPITTDCMSAHISIVPFVYIDAVIS